MRDNAWPLISAEFWPLKIAGYYAEQCMDVRVRKRTTFGYVRAAGRVWRGGAPVCHSPVARALMVARPVCR